ncbi:TniB family NTP-binding protein [Bacillus sp. E214]|uniref:TniB family NTP-binding protein n=1 Tax=Bacillus sp. E214 TaxID=2587156 RepID=UPI0011E02604|nr:TniB family NTP-binding protein [Bacillus sp. E214]
MNKYRDFQRRIINLYVEHPEVKRIWEMLDKRRKYRALGIENEAFESPLHLFIQGKSRVGKTQMMKKYARSSQRKLLIEEDGTEVAIVPVAYMEMPSPFTLVGFYSQILNMGLNVPIINGSPKVYELENRAITLLKRQRVEMLIIDEMDYVINSTYVNRNQVMEQIKKVANMTDVCLVCVGTPAIEDLRKLSDQHVGRYAPVTIPWFKEFDDSFLYLLKDIEHQLASEIPLGLADENSYLPELLHELTGGLIGWLKPILRESFDLLGVFDSDFNDFQILSKLDGNILLKARENVIGQLSEDEVNNFLERQ